MDRSLGSRDRMEGRVPTPQAASNEHLTPTADLLLPTSPLGVFAIE